MLWQKMYKITNIWHFYAKKKVKMKKKLDKTLAFEREHGIILHILFIPRQIYRFAGNAEGRIRKGYADTKKTCRYMNR